MGNAGRMCRISHRAPLARTALACTATCARTEHDLEPPARTAPTDTIGIMIDESTDIRKVKVATAQFLIIACA